jgi:hypothetical protein
MFEVSEAPYKVRFGILKARDIFNFLEPHNNNIEHMNNRNQFFIKLESSILKYGVRNPVMLWAIPKMKEKIKGKERFCMYSVMARQQQFLKSKISEYWYDKDYILVCRTHGGSRLLIAQKHDLEVPCIISDFCDKYSHLETLNSKEEIKNKFKDKPRKVKLGKLGTIVLKLPQIQMKKF